MAKFIQLARCYYNDKDIEDILGNPRFSAKALLQIARERGIVLSSDERIEDVIKYLSIQYFDWGSLTGLTSRLNREESEERRATVRLENLSSIDAVEKAAERAKSNCSTSRDVIHVSKQSGKIVVSGSYIEIDPTKSRAVQREERKFLLEFAEDRGAIKVEYTHSGRAAGLIASIVNELKNEDATKDVALKRISLAGIRDPVLRTDFLLKVRGTMKEFRALDVLDINVDHRFEAAVKQDDDDSEAGSSPRDALDETSEEAEVKSLVRSAALHGSGLLTSDLYQRLRENGYYIYKLVWSAKELVGAGRVMEFEVGFENPIKAEGFYYDLKRVLPTESDREDGKTQHELLVSERPRVRHVIAEACYSSLAEVESLSAATS